MSANLNAAEVLQGVVSTPAALEAVLNQGAMIVNDYVITIEAVDGGYKLIARRGSDEQAMVILNGVDAPVPEIYIETVQGGHKVTAAVGDTVKSFIVKDGVDGRDGVDGKDGYTPVKGKDYFDGQPGKDGRDGVDGKNGVDGKTPVKGVDYFDGKDGYTPVKGKDYFDGLPGKDGRDGVDGKTPVKGVDYVDGKDGNDGISPTVAVSDINGGHRVSITDANGTKSFDVLDGKDGQGGSGGGAQVQSDYTQHDTAAPDYIRNRPFWPEWNPVLLNVRTSRYVDGTDIVYSFGEYEHTATRPYTPPVEGKRYIFGVWGGNVYTGIAVSGSFAMNHGAVNGIGIVDELTSEAMAVYPYNFGITGTLLSWYIQIPDRKPNGDNFVGDAPFFVIEGDEVYAELSADDNAIPMDGLPDGATVVWDFTDLFNKAAAGDAKANNMIEALENDVEITIEIDGEEGTLTSAEITYVAETEMMGVPCSLYMYGQAPLAAILRTGIANYFALLDLKALMGAGPTTKSIKVNYPGIFAPTIAAKKMPEECMPESVEGIVVRSSTVGSEKLFKITVNDSGVVSATEVT